MVNPGDNVELKASGNDPDGDSIYYYWWYYHDQSDMNQPIKINHETSNSASFGVPAMENGELHIILEIKDDGNPNLKRYSRLIYQVER